VAALSKIRTMAEGVVVVSPKMGLLIPDGRDRDEWTRILTDTRNRDPECAITKLSWRSGHHEGAIWALPEALPSQTRADRIEEGRRRRPVGANAYLSELVTISVTGAMGPNPDLLLSELLTLIQRVLGRPLHHGIADRPLLSDNYVAERGGDGNWNGILVLRLVQPVEALHLCDMLHGAVVEIGPVHTPISAFNPRVDSTRSSLQRSGNRRGGRR